MTLMEQYQRCEKWYRKQNMRVTVLYFIPDLVKHIFKR